VQDSAELDFFDNFALPGLVNAWVGGHDPGDPDGTYEWVNGEPYDAGFMATETATAFGPGECLYMRLPVDYRFESAPCEESPQLGFLCEVPPAGAPAPQ
jgi:hypothetical protein